MVPRLRELILLLSVVPPWAGCVQVPSKAPPVEQSGGRGPAAGGPAPTSDESSARGSRPLNNEKIGQTGVDGPGRPDLPGAAVATSLRADPAARPPTGDGQGLTLVAARSLALQLNPLLGQS